MQFINSAFPHLATNVKEQGPLFPWYGSTYLNLADTSMLKSGFELGQRWNTQGPPKDGGGNSFQFVRARAALSRGQLVALNASITGTVTAAGSTVAVVNIAFTGTVTANSLVDRFIYFVDLGATRRIKANTAGTNSCAVSVALTDPTIASRPNDPDVLASVPSNGSALSIVEPYSVRVCTDVLNPVGVALGTVTSGNSTIIQIGGLAEVLTVGSGVATVYGVPASPGAAGVITGFAGTATALTGAAANLYSGGGNIIPLHAYASTSLLTPCMVNFTGV